MNEKTVLAIDPGTSKCGMAIVRRTVENHAELLWHEVVKLEDLADKLREACAVAEFHLVIVGGGTGSSAVIRCLREHFPGMGLLEVDEANTSLEARERYWEHFPRRGWRRFLPATLQVPPAPIDDFVALILAERVLLAG